MTTGERIQKARKGAKLSQKELGEKLGVSASMIGQYENNLRHPKTETLAKIADALNIPRSELGVYVYVRLEDFLPEGTLEHISVSIRTKEGTMLSKFQDLNEAGKDEAIKYTELLLDSNKYRKKPID